MRQFEIFIGLELITIDCNDLERYVSFLIQNIFKLKFIIISHGWKKKEELFSTLAPHQSLE